MTSPKWPLVAPSLQDLSCVTGAPIVLRFPCPFLNVDQLVRREVLLPPCFSKSSKMSGATSVYVPGALVAVQIPCRTITPTAVGFLVPYPSFCFFASKYHP